MVSFAITTRMLCQLSFVMQLVPIVLIISKGIKNLNNNENAQGSLVVVVKLRHNANGLLSVGVKEGFYHCTLNGRLARLPFKMALGTVKKNIAYVCF